MTTKTIGIHVTARDAQGVLAGIERAEQMGIPAAWLTSGGAGLDSLSLFAAAAARTRRILLGTCIVPIFPRHPLAVAQQVQVIANLAPGRFRLGLGPSHQAPTETTYGIPFKAPLGHLREYIHILKTLLRQGNVDFDGRYYKAHARIGAPYDFPIMASALRKRSFELCGEVADGAISWVCPGVYLRDVAMPAMKAGAEKAGRPIAPLVAHAPVCVHDNTSEVYTAAREQVGFYPRSPFYAAMFADAGFPNTAQSGWSDAMIDAVVLWGNEAQVAQKLRTLLAYGATEIIATPVAAGADRQASLDRTWRLVAEAAKSVAG